MSTHAPIGFLGTGIMGFQMARRLAEAGQPVQVWNRSRAKAQRLAAFGARIADTPAAAARGTQALICMLSSGPVCDEVLLESGGALAAMDKGGVLVVMSSIPVETAQGQAEAAAARGIGYLDAPVSGGEKGAAEGTLAIMAGGNEAVFERMRPVLEVMGRPTRVGPAGTGQLAKLVNQLIVASPITVVAEALLLAGQGGADPAKVREALLGGFADSTILRQHGRRIIDGDFEPGGPAKHQLKDTHTAITLARKLGLTLPVATLVDGLFSDLVGHGDGELDHSAVIREIRRRNHLPLV